MLGGWRHNGLLYGGVATASCEGRENGSVAMGKLETHGEFNMKVKYINIITLSRTDLLDIRCH